KDATGSVLIDPTKAEFKVPVKKAYYQKSGLFGATTIINLLKNYDKTMKGEIDIKKMGLEPLDLKDINKGKISISIGGIRIGGPRVGDRKYLEYYIGSDEQTYVLGTAAEDANAPNHIIIKKGENEPTFIISNRSEKGVIKTYKKEMIIFFVISIITFLSGIGLLYFALS
ncbi:MAG: hypothetical protein GWP09_00240, partial [Nitrospiraceae bacterium]|nr:hypothetical protein [Nitrospiraceae bacterium]